VGVLAVVRQALVSDTASMSEVLERQNPTPQLVPSGSPSPSPQVRMLQLGYGAWVAQAVSVVARLGVADVLSTGPRHVDHIASRVGAHAPTLYRLLRAVADQGVLAELDGRRFALTPLGDTLRTGAPGSCAGTLTLIGSRFHRSAWTGLYDSVRSGEPAFARIHGVPCFEYLREHPEDLAVFNAAMREVSEAFVASVVPLYDFGGFRVIVDVGGGQGHLLAAILAAHPAVRGVLFDLPEVVAGAGPTLAAVSDRCRVVGGDFFGHVPAGGDAYLLSNVLHDWADERAVAILQSCRKAMAPTSKLLLMEGVLSDQPRPDPLLKLVDLEMLISTENGRQRTRGEFAELLERSGFRLSGVTPGPFVSVLEAAPAPGRQDARTSEEVTS
jgi:hypothetical protein